MGIALLDDITGSTEVGETIPTSVALGEADFQTNANTNANLTQQDFCLTTAELAELASVPRRTAQYAFKVRRIDGHELLVKEVKSNVGRGGKVLVAFVDNLPPHLRERWYAQHGIDLHEKRNPETGKTVLVADQAHQPDAAFQRNLDLAIWRSDVIRPATDLPKGSGERAAMIEKIAETPHRFPTGKRKLITKQTLYNWVRDYEASGIHGLMRKARTDTGAKRQKVTPLKNLVYGVSTDVRRDRSYHSRKRVLEYTFDMAVDYEVAVKQAAVLGE